LSAEQTEEYLVRLDEEAKRFKSQLFKLSWFMRGGVSMHDLLHVYSNEDIVIMTEIAQENIELTQKSGISLV
jgi:predicted membrane protein